MKISILLASYNGENYLVKQLDSLRLQTVCPDEVLIRDDFSSDDTAFIIRQYIRKYKLNNWKLIVNDHNMGWRKNFLELMSAAMGDIIFICDQDDIWNRKRIEETVKLFCNKDILCVSCRYQAIGAYDEILNLRHSRESNNTDAVKKISDFCYNAYTGMGCTLAYRRELNDLIVRYKPIWENGYNGCVPAYDTIINSFAYYMNGLYDWDKILIKHRFHDGNSTTNIQTAKVEIGGARLDDRKKFLERKYLILTVLSRILSYQKNNVSKIELGQCFIDSRRKFMTNPGICSFFRILYLAIKMKSSFAVRLVLGDLFYSCHAQKIAGNVYKMIKKYRKCDSKE